MVKKIYPWAVFSIIVLSGCATERVISYQSDINPVLHKKCQQCHVPPDGSGYVQTGVNMESYDTHMKGTVYGTVIIAGDSKRSMINELIEGRAGEMMRMPHGDAKKLTAEEVEFIKLWVEQGALNN